MLNFLEFASYTIANLKVDAEGNCVVKNFPAE